MADTYVTPSAEQLRQLGMLVEAYTPNAQLAALGVDYSGGVKPAPPSRAVMLRQLFDAAQARLRGTRPEPVTHYQQIGIRG